MNEVWEDIKGYEGLYKVSNLGNIKNRHNHCLKCYYKEGYQRIKLSKNSITKAYYVHRLVAIAFIPNTNKDYDQINHKNEVRDCNRADNLEWCDAKYNSNYGNHSINLSKALSKQITITDSNSNTYTFNSLKQAQEICNTTLPDIKGNEVINAKGFDWKIDTSDITTELTKEDIEAIRNTISNNYKRTTTPIAVVAIDNQGNRQQYSSAREASKVLNAKHTMITACCKGRRKTTRGYKFEYAS